MKVLSLILGIGFLSTTAQAGNLTFQFINPNFGGNPNNGSFLLSEANAQNSYKDPNAYDWSSATSSSSLDNFTSAVQSQLLGSLMGNLSSGKPGRLVTKDFIVDITNTDGQLMMNILDRSSGKTSSIQVSGLSSVSTY
ncbi:TPA: curli production assembly/transport protein CsgF [Kluyvera ascorbata]|uniref:Curli production assembly/transport component CsgF n=1 Tax=Kluyvera genomosp. 3 TaxID=2774055 RepID=A0A248KIF8_9ENTR|nr:MULTISPECIES: curli production assembly/transport protein CsgF [Kluyvera]ASG63595.1 curli assembly protein CsgF [Kluyvera genomosp. 3]MDA8490657.1 curli production assembly/transport protein CsgF [Kluyvera sp. Awk 3]QIR27918.1 curli production assembly/transport protein CsgF [Kluyvera genomosp. 3]UAK18620.1 curli production assembly/transport protein CsgF [Kluyvera sp. CRP]HCR3983899.1 curli production assembly/transport protein CsgF [Kluyvera ascorbata]